MKKNIFIGLIMVSIIGLTISLVCKTISLKQSNTTLDEEYISKMQYLINNYDRIKKADIEKVIDVKKVNMKSFSKNLKDAKMLASTKNLSLFEKTRNEQDKLNILKFSSQTTINDLANKDIALVYLYVSEDTKKVVSYEIKVSNKVPINYKNTTALYTKNCLKISQIIQVEEKITQKLKQQNKITQYININDIGKTSKKDATCTLIPETIQYNPNTSIINCDIKVAFKDNEKTYKLKIIKENDSEVKVEIN